ncbi:jmjc domain-containing protein [Cyclospora cayetanensis]|uniref:Jmjc domain-containing protein n=1 Tax=Cyclospora cayetanensis TaxID=88456 RepID=A0A1D3D6N4_9EIME|nr:jmjc domain-containing protein [Cyclospora cayetanensis]
MEGCPCSDSAPLRGPPLEGPPGEPIQQPHSAESAPVRRALEAREGPPGAPSGPSPQQSPSINQARGPPIGLFPLGLREAFRSLCAAAGITAEEMQTLADEISAGKFTLLPLFLPLFLLLHLLLSSRHCISLLLLLPATQPCPAAYFCRSCDSDSSAGGGAEVAPSERWSLSSCLWAASALLRSPPPRLQEGGLVALLQEAATEGLCTVRGISEGPEILFSKEGPVWWSPEQPRISSASRLCGKELSSAEERAALEALHEASKNLHELSWTRLHTGHWEAVPLWCREAFAVACILLSFCYVSSAAVAVAAAEKHAAAGSAPQATVPPAAPAADRTATASEAVHADLSQTAEEGLRLGFRYVDLGERRSFVSLPVVTYSLLAPFFPVRSRLYGVRVRRAREAGLIMGGPKIRLYGPLTAAAAAFDDLRDQLLKLQQQRQRNASPNTRGSGGSSSSRDAAVPGRLAASCEAVVASRRGSVEERTGRASLPQLAAFAVFACLRLAKKGLGEFFSGAARTWPCVKLWSDWSRLRRRLGHRLVPVEIGSSYAEEGWTQRLMAFEDFYNEFIAPRKGPPSSAGGPVGYLAQHALLEHLPFLAKEAPLPDLIEACAETETTRLVWVGPAGTVSPLHTDNSENLFVQVVVEAESLPSEVYKEYEESFGRFFTETEGYDALLGPGDCLFIPKGWWHFVKADTPSISISNWFTAA